MKLYKVAVEVEFYMLAEDEDEAYFEADSYARDALNDGGAGTTVNVYEAKPDRVPKGWLDSLPYGGDGDRTVRQILATPEPDPGPAPDTATVDMFAEAKP